VYRNLDSLGCLASVQVTCLQVLPKRSPTTVSVQKIPISRAYYLSEYSLIFRQELAVLDIMIEIIHKIGVRIVGGDNRGSSI
jgi:hypothetical protein